MLQLNVGITGNDLCSLSSDILNILCMIEKLWEGNLSRHSIQPFVGGTMLVLGQEGKLLPYNFNLYLILRIQ